MATIDQLISAAGELPNISLKAATAYFDNKKEMTVFVDEALLKHSNIHELIGNNPPKMMHDNHKHHAAFMSTVFSINAYGLLARTLPWVYRTYNNHLFSYDYFPLELRSWVAAAEKYLSAEDLLPIKAVYDWMIAQHETIIQIAETSENLISPISPDWLEKKNAFRAAVIRGDHFKCLEIAKASVNNSADIEDFYLQILQPVMYEVGLLWERAEISVAQEHLASAIVSRVMAAVNLCVNPPRESLGKIVVAASPNEFHEIGPAMISDVLENDGWEVAYLGANVPDTDLLAYLEDFKPEILALSVTIAFNVYKAKEIITAIKQNGSLKTIKVIVGGRVFNDNPELWQVIGADAFAANISEIRELVTQLRKPI